MVNALLLHMITLNKLNGKEFTLNAVYIEQVEAFPDTTITLTNGKKIIVRNSIEDVIVKVTSFYQSVSLLGVKREIGGEPFEEQ